MSHFALSILNESQIVWDTIKYCPELVQSKNQSMNISCPTGQRPANSDSHESFDSLNPPGNIILMTAWWYTASATLYVQIVNGLSSILYLDYDCTGGLGHTCHRSAFRAIGSLWSSQFARLQTLNSLNCTNVHCCFNRGDAPQECWPCRLLAANGLVKRIIFGICALCWHKTKGQNSRDSKRGVKWSFRT